MKGTEELKQALADFLTAGGLPAGCAWPEKWRAPAGGAEAVISLRELEGGSPGLGDYLGEQYEPELRRWVELYGKKVRLTFGVELWAATAHEAGLGLDRASELLAGGRPAGLRPVSFSAGETGFRREKGRFCCPAQAVFEAWSVIRAGEDGTFLDFAVRGDMRV